MFDALPLVRWLAPGSLAAGPIRPITTGTRRGSTDRRVEDETGDEPSDELGQRRAQRPASPADDPPRLRRA
jgi:hypothetical protein